MALLIYDYSQTILSIKMIFVKTVIVNVNISILRRLNNQGRLRSIKV